MRQRIPVTIERVKRLWPPWVGARVFRRTIFVREGVPLTRKFLAHELCHVLQRERLGWRFLGAYLLGWAGAGFSYEMNPLEVEAREAERDPWFLAWADGLLAEKRG